MILPGKTLTRRSSLLGTGGLLLSLMKERETITSLWEKAKGYEQLEFFGKFVLTLDFLFALGLVEFNEGILVKVQR